MSALTPLGRRTFLAGAAAGLILPWAARQSAAAPPADVPDSAWRALAAKLGGRVLRPNHPDFLRYTQPMNLRYFNPPATPGGAPDPDAPFGVALPRNAEEVAAAIRWSREVNLPMVPRSGGHSYAGCSTIPGLVIHSGLMRTVRHHKDRIVEIGGGALNSDVFGGLSHARGKDAPEGLAITHGRCAGVGVSAFLLGGGIGFGMRDHGLGCDLVESVDLVLADGSVRMVSEKNDPDLLWAVRGGGGGNLGFATQWRLRAVPAEPVVVFNVTWGSNSRSADSEEKIFTRLVRALEAAPDRLGGKINVRATRVESGERNRINLLGQLRGSPDEFWSILGPALNGSDSVDLSLLPYWEGQKFLEAVSEPSRYQETSNFAGRFSDAFIGELFHWCRQWPGTRTQAWVTVFLAGGAINRIDGAGTAFPHRSAQWLINTDVDWTLEDNAHDIERNLVWQRAMHDALGAHAEASGGYVNFPDPGLADVARSYWGENLTRLRKIKRRVDPDGVFTPPRKQGIPA